MTLNLQALNKKFEDTVNDAQNGLVAKVEALSRKVEAQGETIKYQSMLLWHHEREIADNKQELTLLKIKFASCEFAIGGVEVPAGTEPGQAAFNFFTDIMNIQPQHGDIIFAFTWGNGSMKKTRCGMATIPPQLVVKVTESFKNRVIPNIRTLGKTYNQILLCGYYIKPNHPSEVCAARECLASVVAAAKKENESKDPDNKCLFAMLALNSTLMGNLKHWM